MIFHHDKVAFYYEQIGTGLPILFLHGNGEDHTYFDQQVPFFSQQGYQCILIDMRGHGQSSLGDKDLNFTLFVQDVSAFLQYLHIDRICILGFSDGANTTMQFALRYPHMIIAMILNGGNLYRKGLTLSCQLTIMIQYYAVLCLSKVSLRWKPMLSILSLMVKHPHLQIEQLQTLQVATLVLVGSKDMIKRSHSLRIKENIKGASFIEIAGGDHFIAKKQSSEFNLEVIHFLRGVPYGR